MKDLTLKDFEVIVADVRQAMNFHETTISHAIKFVEDNVWETKFDKDLRHAIILEIQTNG